MIRATATYDKFTHAANVVNNSIRGLGSKSLIDMVVSIQDQVGIVVVKDLPKIFAVEFGAASGTKQGNVPVCQSADIRVGIQICLEPLSLRRGRTTSARIPAIRVKRDQMPGADIITIVALSLISGGRSEIVEIACRGGI